MCLPQHAGGLGLRNTQVWNTAALGRYVWAIANKKDCLWLKWVSELYVKEVRWWDYIPSAGCSWYWRKICEVKECIKGRMSESEMLQMADYSVKQTYQMLCGDLDRVNWASLVWNRLTTPKHRFFM